MNQYTSRENDATGLLYYRARYYDPVLKRFISSDPIGLAGGMNMYAYVEGDPVSYVDPEGLAKRNTGNPRNVSGNRGGQNGSYNKGHWYPSIGPSTRQIKRSDGSIPTGPPSMTQNPGLRNLFQEMGNFPNPAPQLPQGAWPGVNFPWTPPNIPSPNRYIPLDKPLQCVR
jgi:RHS repeat-associated protein